jgi:hypothetical protein
MKKSMILIFLLSVISGSLIGQCSLNEALKEIKSKNKYESLVYLGIDVSRVRINDAPKMDRSIEYSKLYPSAWIGYVEKEMPPDGYVRKSLGFKNFQYEQKEISESAVSVDPRFIIGYDYSLQIDSIVAVVKAYKLASQSGLGLVLIAELFSKPSEKAYTWVVFFDIGSRQILYKCRTTGDCGHMGYSAHWGSGIIDGYKRFAKN